MANKSFLEVLEKGVEVWNQWRKGLYNPEYPDISTGLLYTFNTDPNLTKWNAEFFRKFDLDRFTKQFPSGRDMQDMIEDYHNGVLGEYFQKFGWIYLDYVNFAKANLTKSNLYNISLKNANFEGANLSGSNLTGVNLSSANLEIANLSNCNFTQANLAGANLLGANLKGTILDYANLSEAKLINAKLSNASCVSANFYRADLTRALLCDTDLSNGNLEGATLVETRLENVTLNNCRIYGISTWNTIIKNSIQTNLIISPSNETDITTDNLEVAQFLYLLLKNEKIRRIIDTITTKVVLILGRFSDKRKKILDTLREELRHRNYLPILFDFEKPVNRDLTETVSTLAHMSRFVIADITDAKSIPQELLQIIPDLPSVPIQPILLKSQYEYAMFEHFKRYPWVLEVFQYDDSKSLIDSLSSKVIGPAESKALEMTRKI